MKSFITALMAVSSLKLDVFGNDGKVVPAVWQYVLARSLMALAWGLAGLLVLWLTPSAGFVSIFLATAAVVALRWYLCRPEERKGMSEVYEMLCNGRSNDDKFLIQAIQNGVLLIRPLLIFLLLWRGGWLWMIAAGALSMAAKLSVAGMDKDNKGWICAVIVSLLSCAIASKIYTNQSNLCLIGVIACIVCWLLAKFLEGKNISTDCALYIGEIAAMLIGVCGIAA